MKYFLTLLGLLGALILAGCQSQQQAQQPPPPPPASSSTATGQSDPAGATQSAASSSPASAGAAAAPASGGDGQAGQQDGQHGGSPASAGSPSEPSAPGSASAAGAAAPMDGAIDSTMDGTMDDTTGPGAAGAMTGDERIEALDGQLNESFATFDAMILGERAAVAAIADSLPASATSPRGGTADGGEPGGDGTGGGGGPLFEEADLSEPGGPMAGDVDGGNEESGESDYAGGARPSTPTTAGLPGRGQGHGPVPPDLVDGSDDDIVARQIREAAMNEADPVLREKLWDEYRKYKTGS